MSQAIKIKKIGKSAKKIKPSRNIKKAMKSLSKKREPGAAKGAVRKKDLNITERKKAEEEQTKNNIRLDLAIDASQIGVWELDLIKDTSVRNLRHDQIFGYKEKIAEWGAKIFFEHIITEDRPSVQAAFDKAMKTDKLFFECRILWPDKSIHWITATGKTVRDSAGKPQKIFGTVTDITERKKVAEGLEKTRKELAVIKKTADAASEFAESLINTVREPLISLDQDLRVVSVSRSFYDFFKVKPEDTVGQLIYDLGNKQWDIPKLRELLETILPQKASFDNYEVEHEFATIGRRVMLLNARQIQQGVGKERIILLAIEDITERKRLEILLTESEELYKGVFKTASDGIVLLEKREGKITHTNPAAEKMLGYSTKECIGNKLQDIGFMLDLGDFQTTMQNLNKNGIINYEDVPVKTKSGKHIATDIYLVDKTMAVQCNIRDITDRTRAEEALRESENNFRRSLDDSPLGVRIVTTKGKTIYANRTILDFYGYDSMDEINRIPIKERYTPQSYAEFQMRKKDRERGDFGPSQYEINIVRKNGEIRHLQVLRKEILWNGTKQFQVIYQDITERKQAEEALRKSEARYRAFFDTSRDCVFITSVTGRWLYMNDAAVELFGYSSREELSQMNISYLYVNPEERAKVISNITEHGYNKEFPIDLRRKDGALIHALITTVSCLDADGNVTGFQGTIRDITERKRAEESLRESEGIFNQFLTASPLLLYIKNEKHRFNKLSKNFENLFGKPIGEMIGKDLYDLLPPELAKIVYEDDLKVIKGGVSVNAEERLNDKVFSSIKFPIHRESGKPDYLGGFSVDITERKRAEESLMASLAEKEVLLKEVHHRVKNNLMIIIGLIKMQETKAANEMFNPLLHELEGRIRSMALVHESLYRSADLAHVDLQNYIEMMSAQIHAQFGVERDIRFKVKAAGVDVNLDIAVPCGLILNELLTNAFKHAFPGDKPRAGEVNCEINVIVNQEGGMNELTVADNGVGLPADLDWEKSDTLGLRLVKMLSKQINGSIELDRSAGTAFRLKFPMTL